MSDEGVLFNRQCRVLVANTVATDGHMLTGQVIEAIGLRIEFHINKTLTAKPNTANIKIYNLAENTRSELFATGARVILEAGYPDNLGQIFVGDARTIDSQRHGPDWITEIQCGDGEAAVDNRIAESMAPGIKILDVFQKVADKVVPGTTLVSADARAAMSGSYTGGYTAYGYAAGELDRVIKASNLEWSIQDNRIQVTTKGGTYPSDQESVIVVSPDSGMIESPWYGSHEHSGKPPVLKVKSLLQPEITPGGRVSIESAKHHGVHRVLKVTHTGDTGGGPWYTEMEVELIGNEGGTHR